MANTSRPKGFTVAKQGNGAPYNGRATLYYVSSASDEILVGDVVKLGGSADANGIPTVDLCGATDVPVGVVVGVHHSKFDPMGKMTTGSTALDLPAVAQVAAGGAAYIMVADDPTLIFEVETSNGTPAVANVGLNVSHANGSRTASTVTSPATLDVGTVATTSTLNFNLLGFVLRPDNEIGASAKVYVTFNRHQKKSVGVAGI